MKNFQTFLQKPLFFSNFLLYNIFRLLCRVAKTLKKGFMVPIYETKV